MSQYHPRVLYRQVFARPHQSVGQVSPIRLAERAANNQRARDIAKQQGVIKARQSPARADPVANYGWNAAITASQTNYATADFGDTSATSGGWVLSFNTWGKPYGW